MDAFEQDDQLGAQTGADARSRATDAAAGPRHNAGPPEILARIPDVDSPESLATPAEKPSGNEGRLLSQALSAKILLAGAVLLVVAATIPFIVGGSSKPTENGLPRPPAPDADPAPLWEGMAGSIPDAKGGPSAGGGAGSRIQAAQPAADGGLAGSGLDDSPSTGQKPDAAPSWELPPGAPSNLFPNAAFEPAEKRSPPPLPPPGAAPRHATQRSAEDGRLRVMGPPGEGGGPGTAPALPVDRNDTPYEAARPAPLNSSSYYPPDGHTPQPGGAGYNGGGRSYYPPNAAAGQGLGADNRSQYSQYPDAASGVRGADRYYAPGPGAGSPDYRTRQPAEVADLRGAASAGLRHGAGGGAASRGEPGVARFEGTIENPPARTEYDSVGSSIH
jgi:hypothetical protein